MGWKIVRNGQQEWNERHGVSGQYRTCPDPVAGLTLKLSEEVAEFAENRDLGKLWDAVDVLFELRELCDPIGDAWYAHRKKIRNVGDFSSHAEWNPDPAEEEE